MFKGINRVVGSVLLFSLLTALLFFFFPSEALKFKGNSGIQKNNPEKVQWSVATENEGIPKNIVFETKDGENIVRLSHELRTNNYLLEIINSNNESLAIAQRKHYSGRVMQGINIINKSEYVYVWKGFILNKENKYQRFEDTDMLNGIDIIKFIDYLNKEKEVDFRLFVIPKGSKKNEVNVKFNVGIKLTPDLENFYNDVKKNSQEYKNLVKASEYALE